jgi:hypothetical protein
LEDKEKNEDLHMFIIRGKEEDVEQCLNDDISLLNKRNPEGKTACMRLNKINQF